MDELKETVLTFLNDGIFFWNFNEPLVIDSMEYQSIRQYVFVILDELRIFYTRLKEYSHFEAQSFKVTFLESLQNFNEINEIVKRF